MFKKDNINMIVALASLITSITACTLANKQNEIAEAQWKAEQAVNQPIFQIDIDLQKSKGESIYKGEVVSIKNIGMPTKIPCDVAIKTFFFIHHRYYQEHRDAIVEVPDYFDYSNQITNLVGDLVRFETQSGYGYYCNLYQECMDKTDSRVHSYDIKKVHFLKIDYVDCYDDKHTLYYTNNTLCSQEYYEQIMQEAIKTYPYPKYKVDELKIDSLVDVLYIEPYKKTAR